MEGEGERSGSWLAADSHIADCRFASSFPGDTPCPDNTHTSKDNPVLIDVRPDAFAIPAARPAAHGYSCIHRSECNNLAYVYIVI